MRRKSIEQLKIPNLIAILSSYSRDARRDLMKKEREGGCPLFYAAKLGNCEAVEYLGEHFTVHLCLEDC